MQPPSIRPDNLHSRTEHHRRKANPILKWLGLVRHGRVQHKKIRALTVGACVGLITSLLIGFLVYSMNKPPTTQSQVNIPGKRGQTA